MCDNVIDNWTDNFESLENSSKKFNLFTNLSNWQHQFNVRPLIAQGYHSACLVTEQGVLCLSFKTKRETKKTITNVVAFPCVVNAHAP